MAKQNRWLVRRVIVGPNYVCPETSEDLLLGAALAAALDRAQPLESTRPGDWNDVLRRAGLDGELQKILELRSRLPQSSRLPQGGRGPQDSRRNVGSGASSPALPPHSQEFLAGDVGWGTRAINRSDLSQSSQHELQGWGTRPL